MGESKPETIFVHDSIADVRSSAITGASGLLDTGDLIGVTIDVGEPIDVLFESERLKDTFLPSIEHIVLADGRRSSFRIVVADTGSLGPLPKLRSDLTGRLRSSGMVLDDEGAFAAEPGASISVVDWDRGLGVWWLDAVRGTTSWQVSAPFRQILAWWAPTSGRVVVHAAAVGRGGRGVLLAAPGGGGKSTTTMQTGVDGWNILSDDYCVVRQSDRPIARAGTRCCKLSTESIELLGRHVGRIDQSHRLGNDEKNLIYLPLDGPSAAASELDIVAVVVPSVGDAEIAVLERTSAAEALSALAISSIFQFNASPADVLPACRAIVESVPCFSLTLGSTLSSSTERLDRLLDETL